MGAGSLSYIEDTHHIPYFLDLRILKFFYLIFHIFWALGLEAVLYGISQNLERFQAMKTQSSFHFVLPKLKS